MSAQTRALVLSGGGPVGVAWHAGVTASLIESGIDLAAADLVVGTSAGSIVGVHIALGRSPEEAVTRMRQHQEESSSSSDVSASVAENMGRLMEVLVSTAELPVDDRLRAIGKLALESETSSEDAYLGGFAYFDDWQWPAGFVCTAIHAADGVFTVWDADAGVQLSRAIASSCAVPAFFPPITINGARYYDGGLRSLTNADIAEGHERVLVLTLSDPPADSADPRAQRLRRRLDAEFDVLRRAGGQLQVIAPDAEAAVAIGVNLMDPSAVTDAAAAGRAQGKKEAERIGRVWA